jgi:cell division protein FtsX
MISKFRLCILLLVGWAGSGTLVLAEVIDEDPVHDHYIVTSQPSQRASQLAPEIAKQHGLALGHVYEHAL